MKTGKWDYCLGSDALKKQVREYMQKEVNLRKEAKKVLEAGVKNPLDFIKEAQNNNQERRNKRGPGLDISQSVETTFDSENFEVQQQVEASSFPVAGVGEGDIFSGVEENEECDFENLWEFANGVVVRQDSNSPVKLTTRRKKTRASTMTAEDKKMFLDRVISHMEMPWLPRGRRAVEILKRDVWIPFYSEGTNKRSVDGLEMSFWRSGYPQDNKRGLQELIFEVVGDGVEDQLVIQEKKQDILAAYDAKVIRS